MKHNLLIAIILYYSQFLDYSFLTLGTYGTLHEIQFTQELNRSCEELSEYYMGFYIHTCPKMRYKGKLHPSYLLCPEIYTWHLLNDGKNLRKKIMKYFNEIFTFLFVSVSL